MSESPLPVDPLCPKPPKDWRIGLTVACKYRHHRHYYERGEVIDVMPSGVGGIIDKDGVLVLRLSGGSVVLDGADNWMTG